jgi:hypothetical protein
MSLQYELTDAFRRADRELCERIAADYRSEGAYVDADAWLELAARIGKVVRGHYARFSRADSLLVQRTHVEVLRTPLEDGTKETSRALSRLGVLLVQATRGRLAQLQTNLLETEDGQ